MRVVAVVTAVMVLALALAELFLFVRVSGLKSRWMEDIASLGKARRRSSVGIESSSSSTMPFSVLIIMESITEYLEDFLAALSTECRLRLTVSLIELFGWLTEAFSWFIEPFSWSTMPLSWSIGPFDGHMAPFDWLTMP